jgi:hypothetical protein
VFNAFNYYTISEIDLNIDCLRDFFSSNCSSHLDFKQTLSLIVSFMFLNSNKLEKFDPNSVIIKLLHMQSL